MLQRQHFHSNVPIVLGNQLYLDRPRIRQLLERAVQSPLVTVVAGAGYGKTHAVYSFLRNYEAITSWIQLSEWDNKGYRFWENFTQGVRAINPASAEKLANVGFPRTNRQFERYFSIPYDDVIPQAKYIFVYDDFHLIHDAAVLRFLERSLLSPFNNITSIIISRKEPPFNLMGLFSRGLLARITEDELRFSEREMVEYLSLQDIKLPAVEASAVYQDSEGWAFAIHMASLSLKKGVPGEYGRSLMRFNIFKLIESEVFSVISEELRRFLVKLSLIDRLPLDLLVEIAGNRDLIDEMNKLGTYARFDSFTHSYRIHHLLLSYLQGKQGILSDEEKREVYDKAGRWCAAHDLKMDAFSYYDRAGDYPQIITLVYTLPMLIPETIAEFLLEIFERIPPELYVEYPMAYVAHARLYIMLGRFEEVERRILGFIGQFKALPPSDVNSQILSRLYNNLGFSRLLSGALTDSCNFVECFEQGAYYYSLSEYQVPHSTSSMALTSYICRVQNPARGFLDRYVDALSAAIPALMTALNGCAAGYDDLGRGELAFFRGNLEQAEQFAYQALRKAAAREQYEVENRALFYLIRISLAQGNYDRINELFKQLEAQLEEPAFQNRFVFRDIVYGWFYAHIGMTGNLAPWLKSDFEESDLVTFSHGLEHLVRAKSQFVEKRFPAALGTLESVENTRFLIGVMLFGRIERKALEAVCRYQGGDLPGARKALKEACALAEPNGLDMPFIELGRDMRALAGAFLKERDCPVDPAWLEKIQRNAAAYGKKFFTVAEKFRDGGGQADEQEADILSPRELEVLSGLAQGLTREEIAADSTISVNTVKSVLRSVYNKLGALNRADAVRIATIKGMLKHL